MIPIGPVSFDELPDLVILGLLAEQIAWLMWFVLHLLLEEARFGDWAPELRSPVACILAVAAEVYTLGLISPDPVDLRPWRTRFCFGRKLSTLSDGILFCSI